MNRRNLFLILLTAILLAGCVTPMPVENRASTESSPALATDEPESSQEPTESDSSTAQAEPPVEPEAVVEEPTKSSEPTKPVDWANSAIREGDLYIRGNPAAPIRLVDYSDFL